MTRDEIYDHLAKVYLGKRKGAGSKRKKQFNVWLVINIVITGIVFASISYGLTAFLAQRSSSFEDSVIYALHNGPIRITYNLGEPYPPVKAFSVTIPQTDISRYANISFSVRAGTEGSPGIVKLVIKNRKNEVAAHYIRGIGRDWQDIQVPFRELKGITDWTNISDVSFVLESWNMDQKKGSLLIDNLCFANHNSKGRNREAHSR